jgi:capsular polysaccharide biosynthesis protein
MELREYWRVFKRRIWIPILLLIVTVITAGALAYTAKPVYTATATVLAKNQGSGANSQTITFTDVATSNSLALKVIQQLNIKKSVDELSGLIKITAGKSDVYKVSLTDPDPDQAGKIANAVAQQAATLYTQLNGGTTSAVFDEGVKAAQADFEKQYVDAQRALITFNRQHPRVAESSDINLVVQQLQLQLEADTAKTAYVDFVVGTTTDSVNHLTGINSFQSSVVDQAAARPDTSGRLLKVGYAAALALIIGIGLIFLLEYMDNSIRDPETAEEMVGSPVVGIIPKATVQTLRPAKGGVR